MRRLTTRLFCLLMLVQAQAAWPSDACSSRAIQSFADVTVSDGSAFKVETLFRFKDAAAVRHLRDDEQITVVEGPFSWVRQGDNTSLSGNAHKRFALGHQLHTVGSST